jgi:hypothetical protein
MSKQYMQRGHGATRAVSTDCRLGEVHMPLQGQALKTVAGPQADKLLLETCGYIEGGVEAEAWSAAFCKRS